MEDPPLSNLLFILGLILIGGFFSLSEMAVISTRKSRLRAKCEGNEKKYFRAISLIEKRSTLLTILQIGICTTGVLTGILGGLFFAGPLGNLLALKGIPSPYSGLLSIVAVLAGITILYVIFGEIIPKQAALSNPEKTFLGLIRVLSFFVFLFTPLAVFFSSVVKAILALFNIKVIRDYTITEDELKSALIEGERSGIVESEERTMVEGVFYLGDRPVANFMNHRSDIEWLDIDSDIEEIKSVALQARDQAYLPVASKSLDNVIGVVSVQEIFIALIEGSWTGLKSLIKPALIVPETMSALKAFESFKKGETDYLFVMDEYGGFAGALSSRDLTEEIVGELSTPSQEEEEIIKLEDGTYLVDGTTHIDDIAELLSFKDLVGEPVEYHTLAGLILEIAGEIPRTGEEFEWNHFKFRIVDMDGNRIDKVMVYPPRGNTGDKNAPLTAEAD